MKIFLKVALLPCLLLLFLNNAYAKKSKEEPKVEVSNIEELKKEEPKIEVSKKRKSKKKKSKKKKSKKEEPKIEEPEEEEPKKEESKKEEPKKVESKKQVPRKVVPNYDKIVSSLCRGVTKANYILLRADLKESVYFIKKEREDSGNNADFAYYSSQGALLGYITIDGFDAKKSPPHYMLDYNKKCKLKNGEACPNFQNPETIGCAIDHLHKIEQFDDNLKEDEIILPVERLSNNAIKRLSEKYLVEQKYELSSFVLQEGSEQQSGWGTKIFNMYYDKEMKGWKFHYIKNDDAKTIAKEGRLHCVMYIDIEGNLLKSPSGENMACERAKSE